ncbi:hypothetical protein ig2599ANME_1665 [groundwater metagenome]
MTLKITIFLNPPSGCGCCGNSWQLDSTVIRVFAFVKNLKSEFGEEVDIKAIPLNSNEVEKYPAISKLKAKKNLKSPIIMVNNVIKSIGRYPSDDEIKSWRGEKTNYEAEEINSP